MSEISNGAYEMVRAAVNTARESQIKTVKALKARLIQAYPERQNDINEALSFWARQVASSSHRNAPLD